MVSPDLQGSYHVTGKAGKFFMLVFLISLVASIFFHIGREKQTLLRHKAFFHIGREKQTLLRHKAFFHIGREKQTLLRHKAFFHIGREKQTLLRHKAKVFCK